MLSSTALQLAQSLVQLDTRSHCSNLELIHLARDHLAGIGVKSRLTWNADKTKANLFATLGEGKPAGIILSGHTELPRAGKGKAPAGLAGCARFVASCCPACVRRLQRRRAAVKSGRLWSLPRPTLGPQASRSSRRAAGLTI